MQHSCLRVLRPAAVFGALLIPTQSFAHIDLLEPAARAHGTAASGDMGVDMNTNQKSGPCGQVTNMRTDRVATYAPGETITIEVREETPHDSYIRVSLDLDGDDDFPTRLLMSPPVETQEQAQAAEDALGGDTLLAVVRESNGIPNFVHEIEVTLPDETCDNCTLQVIQFMFGAPNPYYYQCADLVIADDGAMGGDGDGSSGSAGMDMGASGAGGSSMIVSSAGSSSLDAATDDGESGCNLGALPRNRAPLPLLGLLALALGGLVRRRGN